MDNIYSIQNELEKPIYEINGFKKGEFDHIFIFVLEYFIKVINSDTGLIIHSDKDLGGLYLFDSKSMELFISFYKTARYACPESVYDYVLELEYNRIVYQNKNLSIFELTELNLMKYLLLCLSKLNFISIESLSCVYTSSKARHIITKHLRFIEEWQDSRTII